MKYSLGAFNYIFIFIFLFIFDQRSFCATTPVPYAKIQGNWKYVPEFSDEFSEKSIDLSKWDNKIRDWGKWTWDSHNTWISNGILFVEMNYDKHLSKGTPLYYKSGEIKSRRAIKYGYFEAKIKGAGLFPGVCPAFWAYSKELDEWTEIDFVELTGRAEGPNFITTNTHVFQSPFLKGDREIHEHWVWEAPWDPRTDFHIYGCMWSKDFIKWYIDGHLVRSRVNTYWHQPLYILVSLGLRKPLTINHSRFGFPTSFQVDYIRVWENE